jgi:hypothetical protein
MSNKEFSENKFTTEQQNQIARQAAAEMEHNVAPGQPGNNHKFTQFGKHQMPKVVLSPNSELNNKLGGGSKQN